MTHHDELRLLPWSGSDEKPCYLSTDNNDSHLSRLADAIESVELEVATELTHYAAEVLADQEADPTELRLLATGLAHSLSKTLRVAHSRGRRVREGGHPFAEQGGQAPRPPAEASG
ncbi:hypothetical protein ACIQUQ_06090 [Streptomyces sp. NPDC101118]|uniref:hypothetical protein n=1 Tax=Streptomyces sp. NPDC101118 TaxID=3366109 RepID=UPI0037F3E3CF